MSETDHERAAEATGVRSVRRALDILGLLTEDQPTVTLRKIVDATGLAKTTVVRLVQTLEQCGLLWDTPAGYTAGPGLWRWAHLAHTSWELPRETRKLMRELAEEQQETVNLFMLRGLSRVCVAQQESPQPLRHVVRVGDELPLWAGASSKILLRTARGRAAAPDRHGLAARRGARQALRVWADLAAERASRSAGRARRRPHGRCRTRRHRSGAVVASLSLSGPSAPLPRVSRRASSPRRSREVAAADVGAGLRPPAEPDEADHACQKAPRPSAETAERTGSTKPQEPQKEPCMPERPLDDIRVLDLTNVLAGPYCSYHLMLLGAEVVKIERPGQGDLARSLGPDAGAEPRRHRGLVPRAERGQEVTRSSTSRTPPTAAVFEELLRRRRRAPGELPRRGPAHGWGTTPSGCDRINPRLVCCSDLRLRAVAGR